MSKVVRKTGGEKGLRESLATLLMTMRPDALALGCARDGTRAKSLVGAEELTKVPVGSSSGEPLAHEPWSVHALLPRAVGLFH